MSQLILNCRSYDNANMADVWIVFMLYTYTDQYILYQWPTSWEMEFKAAMFVGCNVGWELEFEVAMFVV